MGQTESRQKSKKINISAIQMCSKIANKQANFDKVQQLIKRDVKQDVDIIILPEVWTVGWSPKNFRNSAEELKNSETINFLSNIAKQYNCWIVGGSFITKVGKSPVMVDIDGIKTGLTICYDIRFPEIYRAYRKAGADLLINCAAWGLKKPVPWECMTRCRAVENQTFMVALTQSGYIENDEWNIGHSRIIDYKGDSITEIKDQKEGAMTAALNFDDMYEFREKCTCMNDIRENYEVLTV